MQLCSVAHFSVIKIRMGAINCTADFTADCTHFNFDDREIGNWIELYSYWNYILQNTIFNSPLRIKVLTWSLLLSGAVAPVPRRALYPGVDMAWKWSFWILPISTILTVPSINSMHTEQLLLKPKVAESVAS